MATAVGIIFTLIVAVMMIAVLLRIAVRTVTGYTPDFLAAMGISVVVTFLARLTMALLAFLLSKMHAALNAPMRTVLVVLAVVITGFLYGRMVRVPETGAIGYRKGFFVAILMLLFSTALAAVVMMVVSIARGHVPAS